MKEILRYLSQTYSKLNKPAMNYILESCDELSKPKGSVLLEEDKVCRHVWFVKSGLLGAYQKSPVEPYDTHSNWFMKENDVATSVISFFNEQPSEERIVAIEDTVVFQMSKTDLFAGIADHHCIAILTLLVVIKYYCDTRFNETYLRMKEPQFIHQRMRTEGTDLLQRVMQGDMATFLGVSVPTYLKIKSGEYHQAPKGKELDKPLSPKKK